MSFQNNTTDFKRHGFRSYKGLLIYHRVSHLVFFFPTSSWRLFGPLDFFLCALWALRPCDPGLFWANFVHFVAIFCRFWPLLPFLWFITSFFLPFLTIRTCWSDPDFLWQGVGGGENVYSSSWMKNTSWHDLTRDLAELDFIVFSPPYVWQS